MNATTATRIAPMSAPVAIEIAECEVDRLTAAQRRAVLAASRVRLRLSVSRTMHGLLHVALNEKKTLAALASMVKGTSRRPLSTEEKDAALPVIRERAERFEAGA